MARCLLVDETLPSVAADVDLDAYDRKVLHAYLTRDGRLRAFPVQQKKEEAILRYVVRTFELGKRYSEKQVNRALSRFSDDTARLRRNLIEFGLMKRQGGGGEYWRVDQPAG
jgi:hypothetical protein